MLKTQENFSGLLIDVPDSFLTANGYSTSAPPSIKATANYINSIGGQAGAISSGYQCASTPSSVAINFSGLCILIPVSWLSSNGFPTNASALAPHNVAAASAYIAHLSQNSSIGGGASASGVAPSVGVTLNAQGTKAVLAFHNLPLVPILIYINGKADPGVQDPRILSADGYSFTTAPGHRYTVTLNNIDAGGQEIARLVFTAPTPPQSSSGVAPSVGVTLNAQGTKAVLAFNNLPLVPILIYINGKADPGVQDPRILSADGYSFTTAPGQSYTVTLNNPDAGGQEIARLSFTAPEPATGGTSSIPSTIPTALSGSYTVLGITLPIYGWLGIGVGAYLLLRK